MWDIKGTPTNLFAGQALSIEEVLFDFDGPKIFTHRNQDRLHLIYESDIDETNEIARFIASPADSRLIEHLKNGTTSVHKALDQPWVFALDVDFDWNIRAEHLLADGINSVPRDALPEEGTLLWSNLEKNIAIQNERVIEETERWLDLFLTMRNERVEFSRLQSRLLQHASTEHENTLCDHSLGIYRTEANNYHYKLVALGITATQAAINEDAHVLVRSERPFSIRESDLDFKSEATRLASYKKHIIRNFR